MIKLLKNFRVIDWIMSVIIVIVTVFQVNFDMQLIKQMGKIIGLIQAHGAGKIVLTSGMLWDVGLDMLLTALGIFACVIIVIFLASLVSSGFAKRIRHKVFDKVNHFSMEELNKFSTSSLITRTTNDVRQVEQTIFTTLRMAVTAPTMAIFALKEIVGKSAELTWTTVAALGAMLVLVCIMIFVAVPKFTKIQKKTDKLNLVTRENLTGLRVVRAYNAEEQQEKKFDGVNADLTKTNLFVERVTSIMFPGMSFIMNSLTLGIYWIGALLINSNKLSYEILVMFTQYSMQVLFSFMFISMLFVLIPRGVVSARRVRDVLDTTNKLQDGKDDVQETSTGEVVFKDICFKYPDAEEYVLKDISFTVKKGETIAFIGSTGSGKSTLINLIPRFFDVTEGEILINGKNVKDYKIEYLNNILGYVPQKGFLFSGTIKSNLLYGNPNATEEEMLKALKISQSAFVNKLEKGLEHEVAQGGSNLSGGQRQRLCIARAIIKQPEIFIFDDSFSALDYKTDKQLRAALKKETASATKFIVAQRIGTILDADTIVVLDEGKMVGKGTHKQLLESCAVYKEIALSQLSKEEL